MRINKSAFGDTIDIYGEEVIIDHEDDKISNSFFETSRHGTKVLMIVPDFYYEILLGNIILSLVRSRANVFIFYTKIYGTEHLKNFIISTKADVIFCVDCDAFDSAISDILTRANNDYLPEVYKKNTYIQIRDFYADNLIETKPPMNCINNWIERIRFPISEDCRDPLLTGNPIAMAASFHKGLYNNTLLEILNSDDIFFECRTDNLYYNAKTDTKDSGKTLTAMWTTLQQIEQIKIYGVDKIKIQFEGFSEIFTANESAKLLEINFDEKIFVNSIEFKIMAPDSCSFDGVKIEIFANKEPKRVIKPFIKITVDDNFIYEYFVPKTTNRLTLEIYRFHIDKPVELTASDGVIFCSNGKFILSFDCNEITVRAEVSGEPEFFDQIKIHRVSSFYFWHLRTKQFLERCKTHIKQKFKM